MNPAPAPPRIHSWRVPILIALAYTLSYIDRQVLSLLVDPIKGSLGLSDTQFGLMQGLSFSIFFVAASLPLARLADRRARPPLIAACVVAWSVMTMACGAAGSFAQLLAARIGVAVGEAGLPPAGLTLIADTIERRSLPRATALYMLAPFVGGGLALLGGGALYAATAHWTLPVAPWIGQIERWQAVFILVALPGFAIAPFLARMPEPRVAAPEVAPQVARQPIAPLVAFFRVEWRFATLFTVAVAFLVLLLNAQIAWMPAMLARAHGLSVAQVGLMFGPVYLVAGALGVIGSGAIVGARGGDDIVARTLALMSAAALLLVPIAIVAPIVGPLWAKLAAGGAAVLLTSAVLGMASLPFQFGAPRAYRAQALAIQTLVASLIGTGLGPLITGVLSDRLPGAHPLSSALAIVGGGAGTIILVLLRRVANTHRTLRLDLGQAAAS